jgi:hypothetical protein
VVQPKNQDQAADEEQPRFDVGDGRLSSVRVLFGGVEIFLGGGVVFYPIFFLFDPGPG